MESERIYSIGNGHSEAEDEAFRRELDRRDALSDEIVSIGNVVRHSSEDRLEKFRISREPNETQAQRSAACVIEFDDLFEKPDGREDVLEALYQSPISEGMVPLYEKFFETFDPEKITPFEMCFYRKFLYECVMDLKLAQQGYGESTAAEDDNTNSEKPYYSKALAAQAGRLGSMIMGAGLLEESARSIYETEEKPAAEQDENDHTTLAFAYTTISLLPALAEVSYVETHDFLATEGQKIHDTLVKNLIWETSGRESRVKLDCLKALAGTPGAAEEIKWTLKPAANTLPSEQRKEFYSRVCRTFWSEYEVGINYFELSDIYSTRDPVSEKLTGEWIQEYGFTEKEAAEIAEIWAACPYVSNRTTRRGEMLEHQPQMDLKISKVIDSLENLSNFETAEQKDVETAVELYRRFGIANFDRYPLHILKTQYKQRNQDIPFGVVCFPHTDHNGAFTKAKEALDSLETQTSYGFKTSMRITEQADVYDLGKNLIKLTRAGLEVPREERGKRVHRASYVVLGGHGSPTNIELGNKQRVLKTKYGDRYVDTHIRLGMERLIDSDRSLKRRRSGQGFLEPAAPVVLISCSTGRDKEQLWYSTEELKKAEAAGLEPPEPNVDYYPGIAQELSFRLQTKVIAPDTDTNISSFEVVEDPETATGFTIKPKYKSGSAVVFENGEKISE